MDVCTDYTLGKHDFLHTPLSRKSSEKNGYGSKWVQEGHQTRMLPRPKFACACMGGWDAPPHIAQFRHGLHFGSAPRATNQDESEFSQSAFCTSMNWNTTTRF